MSTSSIKRQIRRFYVVVVQWTSKKCTKKRDARAELLFWSLNLLFFWSRRRRCCLSSLKWQIAYTGIRFNYCKAGKTAHFLSTSTRPVNVFFYVKMYGLYDKQPRSQSSNQSLYKWPQYITFYLMSDGHDSGQCKRWWARWLLGSLAFVIC